MAVQTADVRASRISASFSRRSSIRGPPHRKMDCAAAQSVGVIPITAMGVPMGPAVGMVRFPPPVGNGQGKR